MIYNSVDNIPAKLYFQIQATGYYKSLIVSGDYDDIQIQAAWNQIENENSNQPGNSGLEKILLISRRVEMFSTEYEGVSLALHILKSVRDTDIVDLLKSQGYKFNWVQGDDSKSNKDEWINDLKRIEAEVNGLKIRLDAAMDKLPKEEKTKKTTSTESTSFESTCLSYSTFIDAGFVDTNTIVLSQFNAIINIGNEKIKNMKNGNK